MIQASWIDTEGNVNIGMVRVINISEYGLALELPVVPQQAAMVRIQSDKHKLTGAATVRHVSPQGSRCVVGLEFAKGMRWQPPWEHGKLEVIPPDSGTGPTTLSKTVGIQPSNGVGPRPRPVEVKPVENKPAEKAVEAKAETEAREVKAAAVKLAEARSAEAKLLEAKPAETEAEMKLVAAKPFASQRGEGKPVEAKPEVPEAKMPDTKPVETKPVETKVAAPKPAEPKPPERDLAAARSDETAKAAPPVRPEETTPKPALDDDLADFWGWTRQ